MAKDVEQERQPLGERLWQGWRNILGLIAIAFVAVSFAQGYVPDLVLLLGAVSALGIFMTNSRTLMRFAFTRGLIGIWMLVSAAGWLGYGIFRLTTPPHGSGVARWETPDLFERVVFVFQILFTWPGRYILIILIMAAFIWVAVVNDLFGKLAAKD